MAGSEQLHSGFEFSHSFVIGYFVIRHFSGPELIQPSAVVLATGEQFANTPVELLDGINVSHLVGR